ncbi:MULTISPECIES: acetyltransferase [unclassified Agarivorans]|uniref:acetyltransferase n=1 Tax=unclassified Agarivorans TaxID=2636026 RepID=UPI0026E380C6|nr:MULTISPECIES: acetyltransferase [unclassified Agarivorans]MDO6684714.1 acetyltransferase [Agarivorans sp. 3_MG-2023]MDO6715125.1 acetyltransferase [Agarivorans sp. 2_MG-2023]
MDIVIYGIGDLALLITNYMKTQKKYNIIAYTADSNYCNQEVIYNKPLIPFKELSTSCPSSSTKVLLAIGYRNMRNRVILFEEIKKAGYSMINYLSAKSIIDPSSKLGENNIIFPGAIIEPFCEIGDNNIFWSGTTVCHNSMIGNHNFIAARSVLGGKTHMGNNCFVGFNSTIIQNINIENETLIGAGALITKPTQPFTKYIGVPGIKVDTHKSTGILI